MQSPLFYGCGTALVTPFNGKRVDFDGLETLIDWQIEEGADALVVLGTTGEPATITEAERPAIIECAVARAARRVPVIVGTGANDTRTAIRHTIEAQTLGADAALVVTPYYNRASQTGLIEHYTAIADRTELPLWMYNVPARTGVNLEPATVAELIRHPNLRAIKDASGSLKQMVDLAAACGEGVAMYSGNDDQVVPFLALGARGVISVAANVIPRQMHELVMRWLKGDHAGALALQTRYLPLMRALFCEVSPIPVKCALRQMGLISETLRLPLTPLSDPKAELLARELKRCELI